MIDKKIFINCKVSLYCNLLAILFLFRHHNSWFQTLLQSYHNKNSVVIILQCICVSNHHVVYLKLTQCYMYFNKAGGKKPAGLSPYSWFTSFHVIVSFQSWPLNPNPSSLVLLSTYAPFYTVFGFWNRVIWPC